MGKFIDLTGQVFGKLKVLYQGDLYESPSGFKQIQWVCLCKCGNKTLVRTNSLNSGNTKSCGCYDSSINLIGKVFGRLKVIEKDSEKYISLKGIKKVKWICLCECGNIKSIVGDSLRNAKTNSCGCLASEKTSERKFKDLINKVFGKLLVISLDRMDSKTGAFWICKCDCGNETIVMAQSLISENTTSCGCFVESSIATLLKKYCVENYNADKKENRDFINSETRRALPFDIYIPDRRIFIEIHGEQHYKITGWHFSRAKISGRSSQEEFELAKYRDKIKKEYACKNGKYIEVDLRKIKTIEQAIRYIDGIIGGF